MTHMETEKKDPIEYKIFSLRLEADLLKFLRIKAAQNDTNVGEILSSLAKVYRKECAEEMV